MGRQKKQVRGVAEGRCGRRTSSASSPSKILKTRTTKTKPKTKSRPSALDCHSLLREAVGRLQLSYACSSSSTCASLIRCRESEFSDILAFAQTTVQNGGSGCLFVSGQPGTGKSATVTHILNEMRREQHGKLESDLDIIELNGMQVMEAKQLYTLLWRALTKQKLSYGKALESLDNYFSIKYRSRQRARSVQRPRKRRDDEESTQHKGRRRATLLVLDELDVLVGKRNESVLYNIFEWASRGMESRLVVIAIANSMDLPERYLSKRIASRIGLSRLEFNAYSHEQLFTIVQDRIRRPLSVKDNQDCSELFDGDALRLVAKKVASLSGDARRCLDICRRAVEIADNELNDLKGFPTPSGDLEVKESRMKKKSRSSSKKRAKMSRGFDESDSDEDKENDECLGSMSFPLVTFRHVEQSLREMFDKPKLFGLRQCSHYEKMTLRAILADFRSSGIEETTVARIHSHLTEDLLLKNMKVLNGETLMQLCLNLSNVGLLVMQGRMLGVHARIRLNISTDEALFALDNL